MGTDGSQAHNRLSGLTDDELLEIVRLAGGQPAKRGKQTLQEYLREQQEKETRPRSDDSAGSGELRPLTLRPGQDGRHRR